MLQDLEQRRQEDANEISCQRANLHNLRIKVQRDADPVAAEESALEVRQAASEKRKEVTKILEGERRCTRRKADGVGACLKGEKMEFDNQRRKLESFENTIASRKRQEKICSNCGHKRLQIETPWKEFLRP